MQKLAIAILKVSEKLKQTLKSESAARRDSLVYMTDIPISID